MATAFREPAVGRSIPTWETPGAGRSTAMTQLTDAESRALLEHFVALGYLEPPGADPTEAARLTEQENRWTLARANLDGNRSAVALPLLQQLHRETPARTDFTLPRAHFILGLTQWRLKRLERAEQAWLTCLRYAPGFSLAHHYLQQLYRRQGRTAQAEHHGRERQRLFGAGTDRAALVAKLRAQAEALVPPVAPAPASAAPTETGALVADRATSPAGTPLVPQDILVVTGLPRSGTSLLMQLLGRGGFPLLTDGERTADVNNPEGYLEWEPVRQLRRNPRLIDQAAGRAVKVISALLPALPHGHRYRFICATRPLAEIARSQHRMRFPEAAASPALDGQVLPLLEKHAAATREFLRQAGCPVLEVDFPELVRHPAEQIARLLAFVGAELLPTSEKMLLGVKPELHRQRVSPTEARS